MSFFGVEDAHIMEKVRSRFLEADKDSDGQLKRSEFLNLLKSFGVELATDELSVLLKQLDTDNDGFISFEEFTNICIGKRFQTLTLPRSWKRSLSSRRGSDGLLLSKNKETLQLPPGSQRRGSDSSMMGVSNSSQLNMKGILKLQSHQLQRKLQNGETLTPPSSPTRQKAGQGATSLEQNRSGILKLPSPQLLRKSENGETLTPPTSPIRRRPGQGATSPAQSPLVRRKSDLGEKTTTQSPQNRRKMNQCQSLDIPSPNTVRKSPAASSSPRSQRHSIGVSKLALPSSPTRGKFNEGDNFAIQSPQSQRRFNEGTKLTMNKKTERKNSDEDRVQTNLTPSEQIPEKEIMEYCRYFWSFDGDCNGKLSKEEFGKMIEALGMNLKRFSVDRAFAIADTNNDGAISFSEFVSTYLNTNNTMCGLTNKQILNMFRREDQHGQGYLTKEGCREVLKSLGNQLEDNRLERIMVAIDANNDGRISLMEFCEFLDVRT